MDTIYRRLRFDHLYLHYKILKVAWYADTLISKFKSILVNNVANVYTQVKSAKVYPITERKKAGNPLIEFTENAGVHETLLTDVSGEFTGRNT